MMRIVLVIDRVVASIPVRCAFQLAEQEREGGISPHVSPFAGMLVFFAGRDWFCGAG